MSMFDLKSKTYDTIIIPWGAAHMPYFSKALLERGYKVVKREENSVISFLWCQR